MIGRRGLGRSANWVFIDQGLVSGVNFLIGIALVRLLGIDEYGEYVLLFGVLWYLNIVPAATIGLPTMSLAPQMREREQRLFFKGALTWQFLVSAGLAGVAVVGGWLLITATGADRWGAAVLPFAGTVLAFQMHDWFRRYFFARQQGWWTFALDLVAYGGLSAAVVLLSVAERLTVPAVFWAMSAAFGMAAVLGFSCVRLTPGLVAARFAFARGGRPGRDLFLAWQLQWLSGEGPLYLAAAVLGAPAAGAIRAAQNLFGPIGSLMQALDNFIPVQAAMWFRRKGLAGLNAFLLKLSWIGGAALGVLLLGIVIFAEPLLRLMYGETAEGLKLLVLLWAVVVVAHFLYRIVMVFYRTVDSTGVIAVSSLLNALVTLGAAALVVWDLMEMGIMLALLVGQMAALAYGLVKWRQHRPAPVMEVTSAGH